VRVTEQIDLSTTVKFVYVYFSGEQVPFTKRGRMGVVHGSVRQHFQVRTAGWRYKATGSGLRRAGLVRPLRVAVTPPAVPLRL